MNTVALPKLRAWRALVLHSVFLAALILSPQACAAGFDVEGIRASVPRIVLLMAENHAITGSGFVVHADDDGCIVATNHHVVAKRNEARNILVLRKAEGGIEVHEARVIWEDTPRDLALLKVPGLKAEALPLATIEPKQAEDVYAIGYPAMADNQVTVRALFKFLADARSGVTEDPEQKATQFVEVSVSKGGVRRVVTGYWIKSTLPIRIIEHDASIAHGNSGGPLFDTNGHIVGVNTEVEAQSADKINLSSFIGLLDTALEQQGIAFAKSDEKIATAPVPVPAGNNRLLYCVLLIAAVALFIALRNKQSIVESYSHYVRRSGAAPRPKSAAWNSAAPSAPPAAPAPVTSPAAATPMPATPICILEGDNPEDQSHLRFIVTDKLFAGAADRLPVGRTRGEGRLCIRNTSVSGEHLALHFRDGRVEIEDRGSSNGTRINGRRLPPFAPVPIADGDRLELGDVVLHFQAVRDLSAAENRT